MSSQNESNLWKQPYAWDENNIGSFLANEHEATNEFLSEMFEQNLEHARHIENERLTYCTCITALVAGYLAFFAESDIPAIVGTVFCLLVHLATAFSFNLNERWTYGYDRHMEYAKGCYYLLHKRIFGENDTIRALRIEGSNQKSIKKIKGTYSNRICHQKKHVLTLNEDGTYVFILELINSEEKKANAAEAYGNFEIEEQCAGDKLLFYNQGELCLEGRYYGDMVLVDVLGETFILKKQCDAEKYKDNRDAYKEGFKLNDMEKNILTMYCFGINSTILSGKIVHKTSTKIYFRIYYVVLFIVMSLTFLGSVSKIDSLMATKISLVYLLIVMYAIFLRPLLIFFFSGKARERLKKWWSITYKSYTKIEKILTVLVVALIFILLFFYAELDGFNNLFGGIENAYKINCCGLR